jgi:riboflavin kinase/FMN adenylyltransferase
LPPNGVYAVLVDFDYRLPDPIPPPLSEALRVCASGAQALGMGVANVGVRPTVGVQDRPTLEVHLLDRADDLYGQRLRVHFVTRLRGEQKFASLEALRQQIARDCDTARQTLSELGPDPLANGAYR